MSTALRPFVVDGRAVEGEPARFSGHYSLGKHGTRMLYASIDQKESLRIVGFDPVTGATADNPRPLIGGTFLLVFNSAISPEGRFAAVTNRGGLEDLFVVEIGTGEIRQLTNDVPRDRGVFWSPDLRALDAKNA
jgi:Tol biopolymer transport system component